MGEKGIASGFAVMGVAAAIIVPFTDFIRLWALRLGPGMIDILQCEIELIFVSGIAAIFGTAIGQNTRELHLLFIEEGHDPIIQEIGRGDRRLAIIEFSESDFRIGINKSLLIDAANALHDADVEGVLGAAIARALALELAVCRHCHIGQE